MRATVAQRLLKEQKRLFLRQLESHQNSDFIHFYLIFLLTSSQNGFSVLLVRILRQGTRVVPQQVNLLELMSLSIFMFDDYGNLLVHMLLIDICRRCWRRDDDVEWYKSSMLYWWSWFCHLGNRHCLLYQLFHWKTSLYCQFFDWCISIAMIKWYLIHLLQQDNCLIWMRN